MTDREHLIRDKYDGDASLMTAQDEERLESGEPLAYIIGWIPFLGTRIRLDSRPLIPRPETEWWTERMIAQLRERFTDEPFELLDLCAGSGCIGIAILAAFPNARVTFAELIPEHLDTIRTSLTENGIDESRAELCAGDLFRALPASSRYACIASNPPYIPAERELDESVTEFEPPEALFAGEEGLDIIRRIAFETPGRVDAGASLWLECDISNAEAAEEMVMAGGALSAEVLTDQYDRPRVVLAFY